MPGIVRIPSLITPHFSTPLNKKGPYHQTVEEFYDKFEMEFVVVVIDTAN